MSPEDQPPARGLAALAAAVDRRAARRPSWARASPVVFAVMAGSAVWALRRPGLVHALDVNRPGAGDVVEGALHALVALVAFCLIAAGVTRSRRGRGERADLFETMDELGRRLSPLLALPFVAMLRVPGIESDRPNLTLVYIAVAAVLCARGAYAWSAREPPASPRPAGPREAAARYGAAAAVAALWAGYAFVLSRLAITNHHALHTRTFDLGFYDNIFYQSIHGRPLGCSFLKGGHHGSGHFDPILVLLSPLYLLYPHAEMLLVLQAVWLGAGTVPVYLIARRALGSRWAGVAFAITYVLYPALHGATLYDFHSLALVGPLVLWALYLLEVGALQAYFVVLSLALLCREDVPLLMGFVGLRALADGRPRWVRAGWVTIAASVGYLLVVRMVLMPSHELFNGGLQSYGYAHLYDALTPNHRGALDIALSFVTNPSFAVGLVLTEEKIRFVCSCSCRSGSSPSSRGRGG